MFHRIVKQILLILLLMQVVVAYSSDHSTLIIFDNDSKAEEYLISEITRQLKPIRNVTSVTLDDFKNNLKYRDITTIKEVVTIGSSSNKWINNNPEKSKPTLSIFTTKDKAKSNTNNGQSIIFLDQPIDRFAVTIKNNIQPSVKNCLILTSNVKPQNKSFESHGIKFSWHEISTDKNFISELRRASHIADAILVLPQSGIITNNTIKPLLITTYQAKKPVIAYSPALTKAGALVSIHTPLSALALEVKEWVEANHPRIQRASVYYKKSFNESVAKSLKISIPDSSHKDLIKDEP